MCISWIFRGKPKSTHQSNNGSHKGTSRTHGPSLEGAGHRCPVRSFRFLGNHLSSSWDLLLFSYSSSFPLYFCCLILFIVVIVLFNLLCLVFSCFSFLFSRCCSSLLLFLFCVCCFSFFLGFFPRPPALHLGEDEIRVHRGEILVQQHGILPARPQKITQPASPKWGGGSL